MSSPHRHHFKFAKDLIRYLNRTTDWGITFSPKIPNLGPQFDELSPHPFHLFADATWATEDDRKSFQGIATLKYGGVFSWQANRQKSTALSSMEAEIMAGSEAGKNAMWLEKLTSDLNERDATNPFIPTLYCDNQSAVQLFHDTKFHAKVKHIELRYMFVRNDLLRENRIKVMHIDGKNQPADIFTKQLMGDGGVKVNWEPEYLTRIPFSILRANHPVQPFTI